MTLRLFHDDFFRRPLVDRFFDDDDLFLFDRINDSLHRIAREHEKEKEKEKEKKEESNNNHPNSNSNEITHLRSNFLSSFGKSDLIETEKDYKIHVDVPGVPAEDLEVSLADKYLIIKAERKHVHQENSDKVHSMERTFGKLQRKFRIPQNADVDQVETKFKNGVLSVSIPKKAPPAETVRKLQIKVENS